MRTKGSGLQDSHHETTSRSCSSENGVLKCLLYPIVPIRRYSPGRVLGLGVTSPERKLLMPRMFHHSLSSSANTRLPSVRPPLRKSLGSRAGTAGSPRWRGWSSPHVIGARSTRRIPAVGIPTTSQAPGWHVRCAGCEIGLPTDAPLTFNYEWSHEVAALWGPVRIRKGFPPEVRATDRALALVRPQPGGRGHVLHLGVPHRKDLGLQQIYRCRTR